MRNELAINSTGYGRVKMCVQPDERTDNQALHGQVPRRRKEAAKFSTTSSV
jgi:hypothetical protein